MSPAPGPVVWVVQTPWTAVYEDGTRRLSVDLETPLSKYGTVRYLFHPRDVRRLLLPAHTAEILTELRHRLKAFAPERDYLYVNGPPPHAAAMTALIVRDHAPARLRFLYYAKSLLDYVVIPVDL